MILNSDEKEILFQYGTYAEEWFSSRGLEIHIGDDFWRLQAHLDRMGYDLYERRNPGFHPQYTDIGPHNAQFVLIEQNGQPVATTTGRIVDLENFADFFRKGYLFYGRGIKPAGYECDLVTRILDRVSGRLCIGGNTFIVPRLRNKNASPYMRGISTRIVLLMRMLMFREFEPDFYAGIIREVLFKKKMDRETYLHKQAAELWLKASNGNFYGSLIPASEIIAEFESYLEAQLVLESQSTNIVRITKPVTHLLSSEIGQLPPM